MILKSTLYTLIGSFVLASQMLCAQQKFTTEILHSPNEHSLFFEESLPITSVEIYQRSEGGESVLLENGYAKYQFQNGNDWPPQGIDAIPTEVSVIFTQYPKHKSFWLTDYHWLLAKRLEELFSLDGRLNDSSITYNIILQTDCENEFEAMQLFHGIEIKYTEKDDLTKVQKESEEDDDARDAPSSNLNSKKIKRFMVKQQFYTDSTVYASLDRNREWDKSLMVIDWTGSMHGYGAEAVLWQALNENSSKIEKIALFNDGDRKKNRKKLIGRTGGIYIENAKPLSKVIKLFNKVKNKGTGGDSPENDIEAIATGLASTANSKNVILIADNQSCIRDYTMINCLDKPVHVVLCGTKKGINPQYVNLAWNTGGSIHTKDFDLENLNELVAKDSLVIEGIKYMRTMDNILLPEDRYANRFGYCDRYYYPNRRKLRPQKRKEPKCYFTE